MAAAEAGRGGGGDLNAPASDFHPANQKQMTRRDHLLEQVREILWCDWDPIRLHGVDSARDEYDSYAPKICQYLRDDTDEYRLAAHLDAVEHVILGLSKPDHERNRRVARKLLQLVETRRK